MCHVNWLYLVEVEGLDVEELEDARKGQRHQRQRLEHHLHIRRRFNEWSLRSCLQGRGGTIYTCRRSGGIIFDLYLP
jgi:hypothetical protein